MYTSCYGYWLCQKDLMLRKHASGILSFVNGYQLITRNAPSGKNCQTNKLKVILYSLRDCAVLRIEICWNGIMLLKKLWCENTHTIDFTKHFCHLLFAWHLNSVHVVIKYGRI